MWSSYALILLLKIYLGREQWCPSDKNVNSLNCHIAIYQRCNSYSATCVSYQLALNSYIWRYRLKPVQTGFVLSSVHLLFWIYLYMNIIGPTQSRPKSVSYLCHAFGTVMTHLVEFLRTRYYGSLVGAYFGLLSKFSSFCSLFYTVFNLSTKCVGGALCHDLCVRLVNKL